MAQAPHDGEMTLPSEPLSQEQPKAQFPSQPEQIASAPLKAHLYPPLPAHQGGNANRRALHKGSPNQASDEQPGTSLLIHELPTAAIDELRRRIIQFLALAIVSSRYLYLYLMLEKKRLDMGQSDLHR